jgi:hypothetical protein
MGCVTGGLKARFTLAQRKQRDALGFNGTKIPLRPERAINQSLNSVHYI